MNYIFLTGLAGSGKSLLTQVLSESLEEDGWSVAKINLDPSAENLPYEPDFDIKDLVDVRTVLERYGLGSNGALIFSMDLVAANLNALMIALENYDYDYALVDMPGQLEIFSFRQSGPFILNALARDKLILFLSDVVVSSDIYNFLMNEILARMISLRTKSPTIHIINKIDLGSEEAEKIKKFISKKPTEASDESEKSLLLAYKHIKNISPETTQLFISAKTKENVWQIKALVSRIFKGGEDKKE